LTRIATRGASPSPLQALELGGRLDVDDDPGLERRAELGVALAGAGKAHVGGWRGRAERDPEFPGRGHVEAVDERRHVLDHRRHRVGLHGVVELDPGRQGRAQRCDPLADQPARVEVERCAADAPRVLPERHPVDHQLVVNDAEAGDGDVQRQGPGGHQPAAPVANSARRATRSYLPFGLRGSAARQAMRAGTM
jgi:hypothetical protein